MEPKMVRTKGEGVDIQLAVWEGNGKPVICVHGLTANCRCWDLIASQMIPAHQILAMDLRGRGLSDKPPTGYSEDRHVRDLKCVMDNLRLDKAVLLGHSLGGYISLNFAATYPDRVEKLILLDAGGDLSEEQWEKVTRAIKPSIDRLDMIFPSTEDFLQLMRQVPLLQPWSPEIEAFLLYGTVENEDGVRSRTQSAHILEEITNKRNTAVRQFYNQVKCPVLILRATEGIITDDDILLPEDAVEKMLREIPDARLVDVNGTNHYSILFQPNPIREQAIQSFLEDRKYSHEQNI